MRAAVHFGSGLKVMVNLVNGNLSLISNLDLEIVMLRLEQRSRVKANLFASSKIAGAQIRMSSTIFLVQGRHSTMLSEWQHHSAEEADSPIEACRQ